VPTGADVTGTYSILSLILSVCSLAVSFPISPSLGLFFFIRPSRWRDAPLQTFFSQDHNALSHVIQAAISCFSLSLSVRKLPFYLFLCPFPPDEGRQRPFISPRLLVFSVFVLYPY